MFKLNSRSSLRRWYFAGAAGTGSMILVAIATLLFRRNGIPSGMNPAAR